MNKKLLAVAVAGAVATPMLAGAQTSGLSVYGRIGNELQRETQEFTAPYRDTGARQVVRVVDATGAVQYVGGGVAHANNPNRGNLTSDAQHPRFVPQDSDPFGPTSGYQRAQDNQGNDISDPNRYATLADIPRATATTFGSAMAPVDPVLERFVANEDTNSTEVDTYSSRLGLRYNGSVGGGLTVHGQYEFDVVSDRENSADGDAINDVRIATVGVSGDFGRIDIGNLWSAYYNKIGGNLDTMDMIYSTIGQGPGRTSNTIQYSNAFGAVDLMVDLRLLGDEDRAETEGNTDGFGVGISFTPIANFSLSVGYDREDQADGSELTRSGVAGSYNFGGFTVRGGWQELATEGAAVATADATSYYVSASGSVDANTSWIIGYAEGEALQSSVATRDPNSDELIFRLARQLGGGLSIGYEASFQTAGGTSTTYYVDQSSTTGITNLTPNGRVRDTSSPSDQYDNDTDRVFVTSGGYDLTRHNVYMQLDF